MTDLIDVLRGHDTIAVSRLIEPVDARALTAAGKQLEEVPHIRCRPVSAAIPPYLMRVRSWPNLGGYLEEGGDDDIVLWNPSLARHPGNGTVVGSEPPVRDTIRDRTSALGRLLKRIEQIKGVRSCRTAITPRAIVYSAGVDRRAVAGEHAACRQRAQPPHRLDERRQRGPARRAGAVREVQPGRGHRARQ